MSTDDLAPPGSSSYTSNTMHVGDGTWNKAKDTFLLPNLQGLNFATTRYNGMGNRFSAESQYHTIITGHGVLAAITFIVIMPLAIFLAKYGHDWPGGRVSFKLHVYLQIITVFLSTVILVLGWFAVGPNRSLSNPHHGIGVAIYVLILFQFIYGSCWFRRERRRKTPPVKLPLTVWLHRLLGRTTAVLGFVQIGLGLTLYGSPKTLFILYAVAGAFLLFSYLALDYYYMPRSDGSRPGGDQPEFYSDYGSYVSGSAAPPPKKKDHHWGQKILAGAGAYGAYEWYKHRKERNQQDREKKYDDESVVSRPGPPSMGPPATTEVSMGRPPVGPGPHGQPPMMSGARSERPMSQSGVSRGSSGDEKYSEGSYRPTWRERMLEVTGAYAAYDGARALFNRRRRRDDDDYVEDGNYGSALGGNRDVVSQADVSRVRVGEAPDSPATPRVNMGGVQPMTPTMTPSRPPREERFGDTGSMDGQDRFQRPQRHSILAEDAPLTEHVRELGPIAGVREWNRHRKARKDATRNEDDRRQALEDQYNRRSSNNYPRPEDAMQRRASMSGTHLTGPSALEGGNSEMNSANARPDVSHPPLPADAGTFPQGNQAPQSRQNVTTAQGYQLPPPPPGPPPSNVIRSDGYGPRPDFGSARMPEGAVQPDPARLLSDNTAANESSAYGRDLPVRDDVVQAAAAGAAGAVTAMQSRGGASQSPSRPQGSRDRIARTSRQGSTTSPSMYSGDAAARPSNPNSPPVSVKVKMANDGRHVTLRRLNEQEAAAERETRRQERRRRRGSSLSSGNDEGPSSGQRYRRDGRIRNSSQQPIMNVPPPPAMSSSAGASFRRESELSPPPAMPAAQQGSSPVSQQMSPSGAVNESGVGYGTDGGNGTDVSAFADNRKRRRAERARRAEAARAQNRVEFE